MFLKQKREEEKKIKMERAYKARTYYRGTYFGKSIAGLMYSLAQQLNRENNDYLWLWILGITDQLIHNRISHNQYGLFISDCYNEVLRLNANEENEDDEEIEEMNFGGSDENSDPNKRIKVESFNKKVGSIIIERE